jgi:hypothetical protein
MGVKQEYSLLPAALPGQDRQHIPEFNIMYQPPSLFGKVVFIVGNNQVRIGGLESFIDPLGRCPDSKIGFMGRKQ